MEFLLDSNGKFYFMEMNTRIQVEHPVTEMIYNIDLVKEQLRLAFEGSLAPELEKATPSGHAIECRINAEDPYNGFRPMAGEISAFHQPGGFGIRVDSHAYACYRIPPYYDSLIAKVISHGTNRKETIDQMKRALSEFVIEGVHTTIPFHRELMINPDFNDGSFNTTFMNNFTMK